MLFSGRLKVCKRIISSSMYKARLNQNCTVYCPLFRACSRNQPLGTWSSQYFLWAQTAWIIATVNPSFHPSLVPPCQTATDLSTSRATLTEISVLSEPASTEGYRNDMVNACFASIVEENQMALAIRSCVNQVLDSACPEAENCQIEMKSTKPAVPTPEEFATG